MNCQDFERIWNELIDATSPLPGDEHARADDENEIALIEHASRCPACRRSSAGYQVLHRAILAWGKAPDPPVGMADRILAAAQTSLVASHSTARKPRFAVSNRWLIAAAASILAIISLGVISMMTIDRTRDRVRLAELARIRAAGADRNISESPKLNQALASATEATWDLARSASEPAARLSRQFLDAATEPDTERAAGSSAAVSVPSLESFTPDSAAAVETIQQVGDRLASGVRPLSSTARQAFGFLLGPAPPKPEARANPPAARGA